MKLKIGQWGEYDFDKEDAKIAVPLILLVPALAFTQLRKDWLIGGVAAYYLMYFFVPPCSLALKKLFARMHHWHTFRCPYCFNYAQRFRTGFPLPVAVINLFRDLLFLRLRAKFVSIKNAGELKNDLIIRHEKHSVVSR